MLDAAKQGQGERLPYLRNINVRWGAFELSDLLSMAFVGDEVKEFELLPGDVLICEGGEPGRAAVWQQEGSNIKFQKAIHRVRLFGGIEPCWLVYQLQHDAAAGTLEEHFTGSTIKHLTGVAIAEYQLRLPPLAEQRRIVAAVEAVLAKVNAVRERLNRVPAILKRFRQAVLSAACSGRLTADWREKNHGDGWQETTLEQLITEKPRNGFSPKAADRPTAVKSLTLTATTSGVFKPQYFKYLDLQLPDDSYLWLQPGDILIQRSNTAEYVGVSAVYDGKPREFIYPDLMMKMRAKEGVDTRFLWCALSEEGARNYLRSCATGTAGSMPKINQGVVCATPINLPPLAEQQEIIRRVSDLFALADVIESRLADARRMADQLTQAVLAKAFRGELVPTEAELARRENRTYEPAAELLARIRAERQPSAPPANGKPKRTRKKPDPA
jgi:type I restriction enzyme S subunit